MSNVLWSEYAPFLHCFYGKPVCLMGGQQHKGKSIYINLVQLIQLAENDAAYMNG